MDYEIPFGEDKIKFSLPLHWELITIVEPKERQAIPREEIEKVVKDSLLKPIGCGPIKEQVEFTDKVVIVVDDISRPTPTKVLIEPLVNFLEKDVGVPPMNIKIIFGLGVHRKMTQEDAEKKLGKTIAEKISWENHDCYNNLVDLGESSLETPIKLNKTFVEADYTIAVGLIEPHPWAGYSGGYKAVIPGISGLETIVKNHELIIKNGTTVGNIETNPLRRDIDEIGEKMGLNFVINCILNSDGEICEIVSGAPLAAHVKGVDIARDIFEIAIEEQADVVIVSAAPHEIDFRQSSKAVFNTMTALREGGVMIVASLCPEGVGNLRAPKKTPRRKSIKRLVKIFPSKMLMNQIKKQGYGIEDSASAFQMFKFIAERSYIFLTTAFSEEDKERVFVADHVSTMEEAISQTEKILKNEKKKKPLKVLIFPKGGCTYPRMMKKR